MQPDEIKALIEAALPECTAQVNSDDGKHVAALIVSPAFEGLMPVKRQQLVYGALNEHISSGTIHALQMKTLTPAEHAARS
ncbi:BolA family protein [Teredinibacter turnerae]|uniref:BolA family protein n=1 Tax=Teredinibacter turnerae (strain ATCC 39867 / T7901) TaxID=377629 RepID=C5BSW5_TERTT|nr:BolA/IbaG family iron-sulfur metabolism protein [Teredinibacter turnerae]ACR13630.1 BolA family protein [Teredinibacter turnerae T7901]